MKAELSDSWYTGLGESLPTPPKAPTEGLPWLWETFGHVSGSVGKPATAVWYN